MQRTKIILRPMLELFVCHQLFDATRHCLDVVHNQLVQIGVAVMLVDNETTSRLVWIDLRHIFKKDK